MLDGTSVRIAFGVMALTFFTLLCLMASGAERTTYVAWWRRSMLTLLLSFGLFLFDGTSLQRFTNPAGDLAIVAGAAMACSSLLVVTNSLRLRQFENHSRRDHSQASSAGSC